MPKNMSYCNNKRNILRTNFIISWLGGGGGGGGKAEKSEEKVENWPKTA